MIPHMDTGSASRPDVTSYLAVRGTALLLSAGFLAAVVATGSIYGQLNLYDLLVVPLLAVLLACGIIEPSRVRFDRFTITMIVAILCYGFVMSLVAATVLTEEAKPIVQVMFMARIGALFVIFMFFAYAAQRWPGVVGLGYLLVALFLVGYALIALVTQNFTGYYDYLDIPGTSAPMQSGFAFGILSAFFLGMAVVSCRTRTLTGRLFLAGILGLSAVATVSRTNTLAVVFCLCLMPALWAVARKNYKLMSILYLGLVIFCVLVTGLYLAGIAPVAISEPISSTINRLTNFEASSNLRIANWISYFELSPAPLSLYWVTGLGVGAQSVLKDPDLGSTLNFDSLHLRLFYEWGIVGLGMWLVFFGRILVYVSRLSRRLFVPVALVLAYGFVVGFTHEWLFVGVSGYLFMSILGTLVGWSHYEGQVDPESAGQSLEKQMVTV